MEPSTYKGQAKMLHELGMRIEAAHDFLSDTARSHNLWTMESGLSNRHTRCVEQGSRSSELSNHITRLLVATCSEGNQPAPSMSTIQYRDTVGEPPEATRIPSRV